MTLDRNDRTFAVLFVDDEEKAQKYFRMAYRNDFPVLTAGSVPKALEVLEKQGEEIAVLITDQRMPGQQGVDLLKQAREAWPSIVRILTTAYSDLDDAIAAVNRGEILRYVTKPWDINALRVDLSHAMDFFHLRRERDLLLEEKLSVRRSIRQSDRLICLLAIAGGLVRLRNAPHAVAAWIRDAAEGSSADPPDSAEMELWGLEIRETLDLTRVHRSIRFLDDNLESDYPDQPDLAELLRTQGLAVEGQAGEVAVRQGLIESMIGNLARLAGAPASARLEQARDQAGNRSLKITVTGPASSSSPFTGALAADGSDNGLLEAYLIAWHHGGTLTAATADTAATAATADEKSRFVLTLPEDPIAAVLAKPAEDWLAEQFSLLEDWR